jgi:COMPASS component SWD3
MVLQDEANMKTTEQQNRRSQIKRLRKAVLEGDWESASQLTLSKNLPRQHHKRYLYALYKQEYLELIERQEYQKAFAYLNRRLKPMEAITTASNPNEFQNLCYLLTCKVSTVYMNTLHSNRVYNTDSDNLCDMFIDALSSSECSKPM